MSDITVQMDHVFKKFNTGEKHDSLKDLLPALTRRFAKKMTAQSVLQEQEFWALNDVSFQIKRGEAVGIIGHNGAGKSTMLKHLSGVLQPTSGSMKVNGRIAALIEVGAGFHQDLTGRENVYLNGTILGMTRSEIKRKFDEIVDFSGIEQFIDTPVKRYSSGMYARLGFSVAAHLEPEILVIDEVLSVGDAIFQAKGIQKMRSVVDSGATVIFVSHNLRAVADLCPRALFLQKGQLVEDGPTSEVIRSYMGRVNNTQSKERDRKAVITDVVVSSDAVHKYDFVAGEKARISVTFKAIEFSQGFSCYLILQDDRYYDIFGTSTERMGLGTITLEAGKSMTCHFDVELNLAPGSYHMRAGLIRNGIDEMLDEIKPQGMLLIRSDCGVFGSANLYPKVAIEQYP